MKPLKIVLLFACFLIQFGCQNSANIDCKKEVLTVYAAASLNEVINEVLDSFVLLYPVEVHLNIASSGTLARQIEQGETPDIYLSANQKWVDYLQEKGIVSNSKKKQLASNKLVLIAPTSSEMNSIELKNGINLNDYLQKKRISMGDPAHVPAGIYAKQALESIEAYSTIEQCILPAKDVQSALMMVELGECPLGIVYRTDAIKSKKVKILDQFVKGSHQSIVYSVAYMGNQKYAQVFYEFLSSEVSKEIWKKNGFDW